MNRIYLTIGLIATVASANAQLVSDSVAIGASYSDHVWYSFESGEIGDAPKASWDLAFEISGFTGSIFLNHVTGNELWLYPNGDTSDWSALDTVGIDGWSKLFNSDTSWSVGAFNRHLESDNEFDLGWGQYNMTTHNVVGDSLYVWKTASGDYKKLWITKLAGGVYTFRFADLDGSNDVNRTLDKGDFPDKLFGYYSLTTDETVDIEPINSTWDLLFTQYAANVPGFGGYPSTGILLNPAAQAVKVYPVDDPYADMDFMNQTYSHYTNAIGYDWKKINMSTFQWEIADSTAYFVRLEDGDIWRLVMTGFGGSATGQYNFDKEKVLEADTLVGVQDQPEAISFFQLYPNPASNGYVNIVCGFEGGSADLDVYDAFGRRVVQERLMAGSLVHHTLSTQQWAAGCYFVSLRTEGGTKTSTQRLIVQ